MLRNEPSSWLRVVWLVYLGALFFQPIFDPSDGLFDWAVVAILLAIFLALYVAGFRAASDRQLLLVSGAMAALGVAGSVVNGGASVFVIYAAATAAYVEPVRRAVLVIAVLVGILGLMLVASPVPAPWRFVGLVPALVFTFVTGAANIFDAERIRAQRRLQRADEEIERLAALAERERIARDLHDLLGHTLSVIVVKSELAARLAPREPERAGAEMRDVERIGRDALAEVRSAVVGYRSQGLRGELKGAQRALAAAGVELTVEDNIPALPLAHESALAMVVREAVTNIVRHAHATSASIRLTVEDQQVVLEVIDDGVGASGMEGAGLTGMRERVAAQGGAFERGSRPGMCIRVSLPREPIATPEDATTTRASAPRSAMETDL